MSNPKRKSLSEAQERSLRELATFLTSNFERNCTLLRQGDSLAIAWSNLRLSYRIIGTPSPADCERHLQEFIYR